MAELERPKKIPLALEVAAGYLVLNGGWGLLATLFLRAFADSTYWAGWSADGTPRIPLLGIVLNVAYLAAGFGLGTGRAWARPLALTLLVVSTPLDVPALALALGAERLAWPIVVWSALVVVAWNALWFFLIYRTPMASRRPDH